MMIHCLFFFLALPNDISQEPFKGANKARRNCFIAETSCFLLLADHRGDFFSRDNIHPGMMTWHPAGFTHGPHPKAMQNAFEPSKKGTNEVAVMIDTRDPLEATQTAGTIEWEGYAGSWNTGEHS